MGTLQPHHHRTTAPHGAPPQQAQQALACSTHKQPGRPTASTWCSKRKAPACVVWPVRRRGTRDRPHPASARSALPWRMHHTPGRRTASAWSCMHGACMEHAWRNGHGAQWAAAAHQVAGVACAVDGHARVARLHHSAQHALVQHIVRGQHEDLQRKPDECRCTQLYMECINAVILSGGGRGGGVWVQAGGALSPVPLVFVGSTHATHLCRFESFGLQAELQDVSTHHQGTRPPPCPGASWSGTRSCW